MDGQAAFAFGDTPAERFERFHAENPNVYRTLRRLARAWIKRTGCRRLGIKTLYERARWEIAVETGDFGYRLNNDYTAFYARLLMARNPDLDGIFQLRESAADQWIAGRPRGV
ncbi:hypothetical protein BMG05_13160 [Mycobacterium malmoense]|nr:hypothetical protein BMG05_13160 [Mycobacterium malmoense]